MEISHEIKRLLLLGRKAMTNLDSILKSRDITLPIKVRLVKSMVFPQGCGHVWMWELDCEESWAPKNSCFWTVVLEKTLESPWTAGRSNQSILKEISPGCSLEGLILKVKFQYFGHLMRRVDSLEKTLMLGGTEDEMAGWHHRLDGRWVWTPGVGDGQGGLACCDSWGRKELDTTEWLNWTEYKPWTARRSNQSILKKINPEYSLEVLMLKLNLWPPDAKSWLIREDLDAGKDWRQEEKGMIEDEMVEWHHWLDGHEFEKAPGVADGQGSLACCSPWGRKELDTTEWMNWTVAHYSLLRKKAKISVGKLQYIQSLF